jgi:hypothetical protein
MDSDPKIEQNALNNAWLASMADAAGLEDAAQDYGDRMMRAWALMKPRNAEIVFDSDRFHGESGEC